MKGLILAGGLGSRLYPITLGISKVSVPVYDKPLIYYPLSLLMLADIKDILIISTQKSLSDLQNTLGDGSQLGINISYTVQEQARGIAESFIIGKDFIGNDDVALALGDNIFYGAGLTDHFKNSIKELKNNKASIYAYYVKDPERFGIVEFDKDNNPISIEEKPKFPKSNYCVTGLYFYPNDVVKFAQELKPSQRGELEITDINKIYLEQKRLNVELLGRGYAWFDVGKPKALLKASNYVSAIEDNESLIIACLEEIAYIKGWISKEDLYKIGNEMKTTAYGTHILNVYYDKIKY